MIPFNRPYLTGYELSNISAAHLGGQLAGDGPFTSRCHEWLRAYYSTTTALLTHSCTGALEMAALLLDLRPGDEVIMPSFTFVSTANAFVLRGATPVFVDIRSDTLNINEELLEAAITPRTRAIVVVHYAGVSAEMDSICNLARRHNLVVIEDAAQAIMSAYNGRALGGCGDIGCLSFHETKNVISGEGGAIILRDENWSERAEILREKGTNRSRFFRGVVDKYTWVDLGSSYLPGEVTAAFLLAQLTFAREITHRRLSIWNHYHEFFEPLERQGLIMRPKIPGGVDHNGHIYWLLLNDSEARDTFIEKMRSLGVQTVFHYVPLHSSEFGIRCSRLGSEMVITDSVASRLVRLPLWIGVESYQPLIEDLARRCILGLG
jgi:dTDP-4-amino-4,6-dideoxygalactose transaminase